MHVGAHDAEEQLPYERMMQGKIIWVEAQPLKTVNLINRLDEKRHLVISAAVWDAEGVKMELIQTTNTQSTSLLELKSHKEFYPDIVEAERFEISTSVLKNIIPKEFQPDFMNLDIQGAELRALKGYGERIRELKWIYTEVNKVELYEGCALVSEIDDYLDFFGFKRVTTRWWRNHGWGDALYVHSDYNLNFSLNQRIRQFYTALKWSVNNSARVFLRKIISLNVFSEHSKIV